MRSPRILTPLVLLFGLAWISAAALAGGTSDGFTDLFNGKDLSGWKTILGNGKPDDGNTFHVHDGVIVVSGKPNGYFYTEKSYKNYILRYDWKFIKDGNSGLLVHIQGPQRVWPRCIEVQGMQRDHGNIFPVGNMETSFKKDAAAQKKAIKIGEWNTTEVICMNGEITAKVNGIQVSTGKSELTEGTFGFQSEGTELHFKNIKIKTLDNTAAGDDGFKPIFNGKNLAGWKTFFADTKNDTTKNIVVQDGEIQVNGQQPFGYVYTEKSFKNFVIRYSWTYPKDQPEKTTMNSGLLLHMQEPHKVWPKSVEPQGRYKDHGKLFFIGFEKGAKTEQKFDEMAQKAALRPSYEWNTTEVTARGDGSVEVRINGKLINTGKSELTEGPIGFQSEGARIHFKDIMIKPLD